MSDSIIDQATTVVYNHLNGETRFALSDADCIVEALSDAGLLRPEIDADMIERASKVLWEHPDFPGTWQELSSSARMTYRILARTILEAAIGGEQNG